MSTQDTAQKQIQAAERQVKNERLAAIIRPVMAPIHTVDYQWPDAQSFLSSTGEDFGGFELNPDFQRGHVWSPARQQRFIENVMRGNVSRPGLTLLFNCPNWDVDHPATDLPLGFQCIDGLQRYTAVQAFLNGEIKPFGLGLEELTGTLYSPKKFMFHVGVYAVQSKAELLDLYLDHNDGGMAHSEDELARVRAMRDALLSKAL